MSDATINPNTIPGTDTADEDTSVSPQNPLNSGDLPRNAETMEDLLDEQKAAAQAPSNSGTVLAAGPAAGPITPELSFAEQVAAMDKQYEQLMDQIKQQDLTEQQKKNMQPHMNSIMESFQSMLHKSKFPF